MSFSSEKDFIGNEKDNDDQTSSTKLVSSNKNEEEDTSKIPATTHSKVGSCLYRGTIGKFLLFLTTPTIVMLLAYTIINLDGSLTRMINLLLSQAPQDTIQQIWWPYLIGNYEVWTIIATFATFELLMMLLLPGRFYKGSVTPKGNVPRYKDNGLLAFVLTITIFGALICYDVFNPSIIYDNFMYLIGALNLLGLSMSIILFIKGKYLPSTSDVANDGLIADLFQGIELHPQILRCDVKLFTNSRFGMMGWALLLLSYAHKQYQSVGEITDSMAVAVVLQLIYIMKFFYWEKGYTRSLDIVHDRAGFYIVSSNKRCSSSSAVSQ